MLSHTVALSILLLHSLDRDINKKRKRAITVTKALTAQGKWHVNLSSGRLELAGNNCAPRSVRLTAPETFLADGWVCLAVEQGMSFPCSDTHLSAQPQQPRAPQAIKRPSSVCFVSDLKPSRLYPLMYASSK